VITILSRGTGWSGSFLTHLAGGGLGDGGYSIPFGVGQSDPLPWTGINRVTLVFDENVVEYILTKAQSRYDLIVIWCIIENVGSLLTLRFMKELTIKPVACM